MGVFAVGDAVAQAGSYKVQQTLLLNLHSRMGQGNENLAAVYRTTFNIRVILTTT